MKINKMKFSKAFSLVEIMVTIGILGLVISTLLTIIYTIKINQEKLYFKTMVPKKATKYIITHLLSHYDIYGRIEQQKNLENFLKNKLPTFLNQKFSEDQELRGVEVKQAKPLIELKNNKNKPQNIQKGDINVELICQINNKQEKIKLEMLYILVPPPPPPPEDIPNDTQEGIPNSSEEGNKGGPEGGNKPTTTHHPSRGRSIGSGSIGF